MLWINSVNENEIINQMNDEFYNRTYSLVAIINDEIVGRIEYHFYGTLQDGYRMAYVDYVYTLTEFRKQGVARELFKEFEKECKHNNINQYFLIRATNESAKKFYDKFIDVENDNEPVLRKTF